MSRILFARALWIASLIAASGIAAEAEDSATGLRPGETAVEVDAVFPGAEPPDVAGTPASIVFRVTDRATGEPIEGARVAVFTEADRVVETTWPALATVASDADGWVRLDATTVVPASDEFWISIDAAGHAPVFVMNRPDEDGVALERGVDVPLAVRDEADRPVANCRVGLILGCGHTPDARSATTDERGLATLPCVAPESGDLWPSASGFESRYTPLGAWEPGDPPVVVRLRRSADATGVLLDAATKKPLAGVPVGAPHCHRGPWTRTGADGRFRLLGAEPGASELAIVLGPDREASASRAPAGVDRVIAIPAPSLDESFVDVDDEEAVAVPLDVSIAGHDDEFAYVVTAVRAADGLTATETIDDGEPAEIRLPAGKYAVTAEAAELAGGRASREIEVRTGSGAEPPRPVVLELPGFRRASLRMADPPDDLAVTLVAPSSEGERDVTDAVLAGEPVALPSPGPVLARVESGDRSAVVLIPDDATKRLVDLPPLPAARVRARLVAADGSTPVRARFAVAREADPDLADAGVGDRVDVATRFVGRAFLVAEAGDRRTVVPLRVPAEPGAVIDLGAVRVGPGLEPALRVTNGERAEATIERPGVSDRATLDAAGGWTGSIVPVAGDRVTVVDRTDARLPLRVTLEGGGPWALAWPGGAVRVTAVAAEDGAPVDGAVVLVRGRAYETTAGALAMGGLTARDGESIIVAAPGRVAVRLALRLETSGAREVTVRLRRRG